MDVLVPIWNGILELTSRFVIPDWGAAVGLLPALLLLIIAIYLVRTAWRFATAGPTRRVPRRRAPVAPADIHLPGPSIAPLLGALGKHTECDSVRLRAAKDAEEPCLLLYDLPQEFGVDRLPRTDVAKHFTISDQSHPSALELVE